MRALRGSNAAAVLATIIPITRGWASFYRGATASRVFSALDAYLWELLYKWGTYSHPNKPKDWLIKRYFGRFNKARQDHWVFGDRDSGAYLPKVAWTKIVRHQMVPGRASPDDPALDQYWATRRRKNTLPLDRGTLHLLQTQRGRCPLCGTYLLHADREPQNPSEWEQWHRTTRKAITKQYITASGNSTPDDTRLVHVHCHRHTTGVSKDSATPTHT